MALPHPSRPIRRPAPSWRLPARLAGLVLMLGLNLDVHALTGAGRALAQPTESSASHTAGPGAASVPPARASVDVNTASAAELERIRGIGPSMATRIVNARVTGGRFRDVDDLRRRVRGIGGANLKRMVAAGLVVGGSVRLQPARAAARDRVDLLVGNAAAKAEPRGLGRVEELGCCGMSGAGSATPMPEVAPASALVSAHTPPKTSAETAPRSRRKRPSVSAQDRTAAEPIHLTR